MPHIKFEKIESGLNVEMDIKAHDAVDLLARGTRAVLNRLVDGDKTKLAMLTTMFGALLSATPEPQSEVCIDMSAAKRGRQ